MNQDPYGERIVRSAQDLKAAAMNILLSGKYDKVNGIGCAEVVVNAGSDKQVTNHKYIQVINKDTGVIYSTIKEAAASIKMDGSDFARRLKRKTLKQFDYYEKI